MRHKRTWKRIALDVAADVMPGIGQIAVGLVVLYALGRIVGGAA